MGICEGENNRKNRKNINVLNSNNNSKNINALNSNNNSNGRIKEVEIGYSKITKVNTYLFSVCQSVCKILYQNKKGTGFLIKLKKDNKDFNCLLTNEHVVGEDLIKANEVITVNYDCEKREISIYLNKKQRFIKYYLDYDISIIEILPNDGIDNNYFLLPYTDNINSLENKKIYIPQFPRGGDLSYSEGRNMN